MSKDRYLVLIGGCIIASGIAAITNFHFLLDPTYWLTARKQDLFSSLIGSGNGYFCSGYVIFIMIIEYLIGINYLQKNDEQLFLVRHKNREAYYVRRLRKCFAGSLIIVIVHYFIGFSVLYVFFGRSYIFNIKTLLFIMASVVILVIFIARASIIYSFINDKVHKELIALIITLGIYILEFTIVYILQAVIWMPIMDLELSISLYMNLEELIIVLLAVIRNLGINLIIAYICLWEYKKKDVLNIEK